MIEDLCSAARKLSIDGLAIQKYHTFSLNVLTYAFDETSLEFYINEALKIWLPRFFSVF
jgi:hypothetical protein